jgi:hypothetical protein
LNIDSGAGKLSTATAAANKIKNIINIINKNIY